MGLVFTILLLVSPLILRIEDFLTRLFLNFLNIVLEGFFLTTFFVVIFFPSMNTLQNLKGMYTILTKLIKITIGSDT